MDLNIWKITNHPPSPELVSLVSLDFDRRNFGQSKDYFASRKRQTLFNMVTGNLELMHECFPKHSRMGTAEWNKTKKQKVRRQAWVWKEVKRGKKIQFKNNNKKN